MYTSIRVPKVSYAHEGLSIYAANEGREDTALGSVAEQLSELCLSRTEPANGVAFLSHAWSKTGRGLIAIGMIDQGMSADRATQLTFSREVESNRKLNDSDLDKVIPTTEELSDITHHIPFIRLPEGIKPSVPIVLGANMARMAHSIVRTFCNPSQEASYEQTFTEYPPHGTPDRLKQGVLKTAYTLEVDKEAADVVRSQRTADEQPDEQLSIVSLAVRDSLFTYNEEEDSEKISKGEALINFYDDMGFTLTEVYGDGNHCRIREFNTRLSAELFRTGVSLPFFKIQSFNLLRNGSSPEISVNQVLGIEGILHELRSAARLLGTVATSASISEEYQVPSVYQIGDEPEYHSVAAQHETIFRSVVSELSDRRKDILPYNLKSAPLEDLLSLCSPNVPHFGNRFKVTRFVVGPAEVPLRDVGFDNGESPITVPAGNVLIEFDDVANLSGNGALDMYKIDSHTGEAKYVETLSSWVS